MRIVVISDTHALHDQVEVPDGDILVHAGDLTNRGAVLDVERFNTFLGKLPHRHKIVIAGNHDFCFERKPLEARAALTNATYLEDQALTVEGLRFYGSPWQPWFYNWAFNLERGPDIRAKWDLIPEETDILITHGPPMGHGDLTPRGERVGCQDLRDRIRQVRPRYHLFGHIHEGYGVTKEDDMTFVNAASCTLKYEPINPAIVLDL